MASANAVATHGWQLVSSAPITGLGVLKGTLQRPPLRDSRKHCPAALYLPGFAAPKSSPGLLWSHAGGWTWGLAQIRPSQ